MKVLKYVFVLFLFFSSILTKPPKVEDRRLLSYPYISGDGFRAMADHVFDETDIALRSSEIQKGDIVFVKTDFLKRFFSRINRYIKHEYILVTHNADDGAPKNFERYLKDKKIKQVIKILGVDQNGPLYRDEIVSSL